MAKRVAIPGAMFNVEDVGQGTPILFVHGFPLDHTMWRHQIADLPSDFRCIAPDLRGFGQSTVSEGTVTMEQFADDLAALLDALHVTEPIVFCGHSMGGYIAWQFAHRHADRVKGLILCDTRAVPDTPEAAANRLKLADDVLQHGSELVANAMLPRLFVPSTEQTRPVLLDEIRQVIIATNRQGIAAASRGMAERADARPWLSSISVPSLVLVGEHDAISTAAEMRVLASMIPSARFDVVPNAGHMAPLENSISANVSIRREIERWSLRDE